MPIAQLGKRGREAARTTSPPRLGVVGTYPIQYQAPLCPLGTESTAMRPVRAGDSSRNAIPIT